MTKFLGLAFAILFALPSHALDFRGVSSVVFLQEIEIAAGERCAYIPSYYAGQPWVPNISYYPSAASYPAPDSSADNLFSVVFVCSDKNKELTRRIQKGTRLDTIKLIRQLSKLEEIDKPANLRDLETYNHIVEFKLANDVSIRLHIFLNPDSYHPLVATGVPTGLIPLKAINQMLNRTIQLNEAVEIITGEDRP